MRCLLWAYDRHRRCWDPQRDPTMKSHQERIDPREHWQRSAKDVVRGYWNFVRSIRVLEPHVNRPPASISRANSGQGTHPSVASIMLTQNLHFRFSRDQWLERSYSGRLNLKFQQVRRTWFLVRLLPIVRNLGMHNV